MGRSRFCPVHVLPSLSLPPRNTLTTSDFTFAITTTITTPPSVCQLNSRCLPHSHSSTTDPPSLLSPSLLPLQECDLECHPSPSLIRCRFLTETVVSVTHGKFRNIPDISFLLKKMSRIRMHFVVRRVGVFACLCEGCLLLVSMITRRVRLRC